MKNAVYSLILSAASVFSACNEEEVKLPDIAVNFSSTATGIDPESREADVMLDLSRAAGADVKVRLNFTATGVGYGAGFTTVPPAAADGGITVVIPAGATSGSVRVDKTEALYDGTEKIVFTLAAADNGVVVGDKKEMTLSFGAGVSEGDRMTLQGRVGDDATANTVYVDLSRNAQTPVDRKSWTLGFYCGGEFRVFLNAACKTAAAATAKTDIDAVTPADADAAPPLVADMMTGQLISPDNVDDFAGNIKKTAFAEIADNDADNKVYLVAFEDNNARPEDYYKVKVTRRDNGYTVQYGRLGGGEIKTADITKDAAYNMVALSLADGTTSTPEPRKWDFQWSYGTGSTVAGGEEAALFMQDYVSLNTLGGARAVEVSTSTMSYDNFKASDLAGLAFSSARNVIADRWRSVMPPAAGVSADRFYVVKDADGNYYKLKFVRMGVNNDGGIRGLPQIEYKIVR